ncbi:hypothetical protein H6802_01985 [Candidatus Nomurabacteria bacterium]|uniref:Uncharacterized protein n=1 Tax=candidate division WWE3 bacterium TaxID=2053526 RepID=A0A955IW26_UNCKA|nr:hypothetical protein [candidate division WWE3 bacterium]MCB9823701.1 hypothetical protein [Candidatus Nomurabacteria bacterium]MCB9827220.1 hypothetical protein [Candidatus Nomurabacteria bacterium]MCB9827496.1 hypothetical protein [Candidatus Nomurabacteria bacterium]HXK52641.1 hypothetical protein [bacterium]
MFNSFNSFGNKGYGQSGSEFGYSENRRGNFKFTLENPLATGDESLSEIEAELSPLLTENYNCVPCDFETEYDFFSRGKNTAEILKRILMFAFSSRIKVSIDVMPHIQERGRTTDPTTGSTKTNKMFYTDLVEGVGSKHRVQQGIFYVHGDKKLHKLTPKNYRKGTSMYEGSLHPFDIPRNRKLDERYKLNPKFCEYRPVAIEGEPDFVVIQTTVAHRETNKVAYEYWDILVREELYEPDLHAKQAANIVSFPTDTNLIFSSMHPVAIQAFNVFVAKVVASPNNYYDKEELLSSMGNLQNVFDIVNIHIIKNKKMVSVETCKLNQVVTFGTKTTTNVSQKQGIQPLQQPANNGDPFATSNQGFNNGFDDPYLYDDFNNNYPSYGTNNGLNSQGNYGLNANDPYNNYGYGAYPNGNSNYGAAPQDQNQNTDSLKDHDMTRDDSTLKKESRVVEISDTDGLKILTRKRLEDKSVKETRSGLGISTQINAEYSFSNFLIDSAKFILVDTTESKFDYMNANEKSSRRERSILINADKLENQEKAALDDLLVEHSTQA